MKHEAVEVPRLEEMQAFVRVVDAGSFSRARELGQSTSAVSKQVRVLEQRLGVRLLNRTTRALSLTEAGRLFEVRSRQLLADAVEPGDAVRGLAHEPRGTLRISAPQDFGRLHLCGLIGTFAAAHPALGLELDMNDRVVDLVAEGFDVAIRIAALEDSSLVVRRLAPCRRVLCAAPSYLDAHGAPRTPADLSRHACIEYLHGVSDGGGWRFRVEGRTSVVRPNGRLRTNAGWAMREMVLAGQGLALLPTFLVADDLRAGRLRTVLDAGLDADTELVALYPSSRQLAAKVRLFVDHLATRFGPPPPGMRASDAG